MSYIHFELIFVQGKIRVSSLLFFMWISSFSALLVKQIVLFPVNLFDTFEENQMAMAMWICFWIFSSIALVCVFLCQYHAGFVTVAL
jgi:hypothetical protein